MKRIYFDGLNLSLERGTGIATYTRVLAGVARDLGYEIGVVYSSPQRPAKNPLLREIAFFDSREAAPVPFQRRSERVSDQIPGAARGRAERINLTGWSSPSSSRARLPLHDHMFVARNLFANARRYFSWSGRFVDLMFDCAPDILHCTYQLPLRAKGVVQHLHHPRSGAVAPAVHDARQQAADLQAAAQDRRPKRTTSSRCRRTRSATSCNCWGSRNRGSPIPTRRSNSRAMLVDAPTMVAEQLRRFLSVSISRDYLLFYGALEPKKNVARLIDAYMLVGGRHPAGDHRCGRLGQHDEAKRLRGNARRGAGQPERQTAASIISNMSACRCWSP